MCTTCGCESNENKITMTVFGEKQKQNKIRQHHRHHNHEHKHTHEHRKHIDLEIDVLSKNNLLAERNRGYFEAKNIFTLNMMSSPGSGKTTLLERTVRDLKNKIKLYIIEGDQQTMNDAERIGNAGAPVIQVNTGNGCHLDADMINKAVKKLNPDNNSLIFIENVGNLVCPSLFDLGENKRIVIMSVTEGEDKPVKYPVMFENADICIINKTDLLPYLNYDVEKAKKYALQVNHHLKFIEMSATTGEGIQKWYDYLLNRIKQ